MRAGDGFLREFLAKAEHVSPGERAALLETSEAIAEAHDEVAHEGQTQVRCMHTDSVSVVDAHARRRRSPRRRSTCTSSASPT